MDARGFVDESACLDLPREVGGRTKIWHFCHALPRARIGQHCILAQNDRVIIGNHVKLQNNVSLFTGVVIEDDDFFGPPCLFTNLANPGSEIVRHPCTNRRWWKWARVAPTPPSSARDDRALRLHRGDRGGDARGAGLRAEDWAWPHAPAAA